MITFMEEKNAVGIERNLENCEARVKYYITKSAGGRLSKKISQCAVPTLNYECESCSLTRKAWRTICERKQLF